MEMNCEMFWGLDSPARCKSKNTVLVEVTLATGKKKTICMCEKCQRKYFGEVRRPTKHALDGA